MREAARAEGRYTVNREKAMSTRRQFIQTIPPVRTTFAGIRETVCFPPIRALNKALDPISRKSCGNHVAGITSSGMF